MVIVHSSRGDVAAGKKQELQRALGGLDGFGLQLPATHVLQMILDLLGQRARRGAHGQLGGIACVVLQTALPSGFVECGEDAFLEIDGGFPASDNSEVNAVAANVDAFQMQEAEGRSNVIVECCGGVAGHGSLPSKDGSRDMTGREFVNGGDTKICGVGAVLRCWGVPSGVLPRFANSLPGRNPYIPRDTRKFGSIYRSHLCTVCIIFANKRTVGPKRFS